MLSGNIPARDSGRTKEFSSDPDIRFQAWEGTDVLALLPLPEDVVVCDYFKEVVVPYPLFF